MGYHVGVTVGERYCIYWYISEDDKISRKVSWGINYYRNWTYVQILH